MNAPETTLQMLAIHPGVPVPAGHGTLNDIRNRIGSLAWRLCHGCGNHGCRIKAPIGQGTNANCTCSPLRVSRELLELAADAERLHPNWGSMDKTIAIIEQNHA